MYGLTWNDITIICQNDKILSNITIENNHQKKIKRKHWKHCKKHRKDSYIYSFLQECYPSWDIKIHESMQYSMAILLYLKAFSLASMWWTLQNPCKWVLWNSVGINVCPLKFRDDNALCGRNKFTVLHVWFCSLYNVQHKKRDNHATQLNRKLLLWLSWKKKKKRKNWGALWKFAGKFSSANWFFHLS